MRENVCAYVCVLCVSTAIYRERERVKDRKRERERERERESNKR